MPGSTVWAARGAKIEVSRDSVSFAGRRVVPLLRTGTKMAAGDLARGPVDGGAERAIDTVASVRTARAGAKGGGSGGARTAELGVPRPIITQTGS